MFENQEPHLAGREKEIIRLAAKGLTDKAIALQLGISEATVGTYWSRVRAKLGPYNRTKLVFLLVRAHWEEEVLIAQAKSRHLQERLDQIHGTSLSKRAVGPKWQDCHAVLDELPAAVILMDREHSIAFANRAAGQITGYSSLELVGRTANDLFIDGWIENLLDWDEEILPMDSGSFGERSVARSEIQIDTVNKWMPTASGAMHCCILSQRTAGQGRKSVFRTTTRRASRSSSSKFEAA